MPNSLELNVSPAQLHTFANHPFHVRKDMEMNELVDSIRESGVIVPLIVRNRPEGGYEIISGHRRCEACRELGIEKVPVRVQELTDDEATILMVNSNIQREHVLPSEKAFAYRMKLEAVKRTAGRPSRNSCQVGTNFRADKNVAETSSESARTIQRYIRLTYLISPILQMVDESRMAFNPAVEISYMTPEHQRWLQAEMELCEATPSLVQSRRLKRDEPERHADGALPAYPAHRAEAQSTAEVFLESIRRTAVLPSRLYARADAEHDFFSAENLGPCPRAHPESAGAGTVKCHTQPYL